MLDPESTLCSLSHPSLRCVFVFTDHSLYSLPYSGLGRDVSGSLMRMKGTGSHLEQALDSFLCLRPLTSVSLPERITCCYKARCKFAPGTSLLAYAEGAR